MTVPPLAHAGHWLAQIAYLLPLVILVGVLVTGWWKGRREAGASPPEPRD